LKSERVVLKMSDNEEPQIPTEVVAEVPKEETPKKKGRKPRAKKAKAAADKVRK